MEDDDGLAADMVVEGGEMHVRTSKCELETTTLYYKRNCNTHLSHLFYHLPATTGTIPT